MPLRWYVSADAWSCAPAEDKDESESQKAAIHLNMPSTSNLKCFHAPVIYCWSAPTVFLGRKLLTSKELPVNVSTMLIADLWRRGRIFRGITMATGALVAILLCAAPGGPPKTPPTKFPTFESDI